MNYILFIYIYIQTELMLWAHLSRASPLLPCRASRYGCLKAIPIFPVHHFHPHLASGKLTC